MSTFVKGGGVSTPFGRNEYMRSTRGTKYESYTLAASTITAVTIDGNAGQKILQPGTVLAKITAGPEAGKVGPFQASGTAEIQTITKTGTWSGGTYTLTINGITTAAIPYNASAAVVQAALAAVGINFIAVTGGSLDTTPLVLTWQQGGNAVTATINTASVTGSTPGAGVVETTAGVSGAVDGRQTLANIVGLCDTFLPYQTMDRDVEVSALYDGTAVQAWCFEYNAAGVPITLTNTTADAMRGTKGLDVTFK